MRRFLLICSFLVASGCGDDKKPDVELTLGTSSVPVHTSDFPLTDADGNTTTIVKNWFNTRILATNNLTDTGVVISSIEYKVSYRENGVDVESTETLNIAGCLYLSVLQASGSTKEVNGQTVPANQEYLGEKSSGGGTCGTTEQDRSTLYFQGLPVQSGGGKTYTIELTVGGWRGTTDNPQGPITSSTLRFTTQQ